MKKSIKEANHLIKEKKYKEAVDLYRNLLSESSFMEDQINLNIQFAEKKIKAEGKKETLADKKFSVVASVDVFNDVGIHGWIYYKDNPSFPVALDFYVNDEFVETFIANLIREDVKLSGHPTAECGFHIDFLKFIDIKKFNDVKIYLSKTDISAFDFDMNLSSSFAKIESISSVAKFLRKNSFQEELINVDWVINCLFPKLIQECRGGNLNYVSDYKIKNKELLKINSNIVDVVVPVYDGLDETLNCIKSVINSKNNTNYRLIVIDDCSPNISLSKELDVLQDMHKFILLKNKTNLGFVGTVNRGMRFSSDNDVILLNSDTVVPDGWIDQIFEAAYSEDNIGTVTPFSNNATICSYPNFCQDNNLIDGYHVNDVNKIFRRSNFKKNIDLPTAHGFCMFIKRDVLNDVGFFDEKKWGKGYAEENDFSLRAEAHGWRNVLALDTFVQHLGSVSFSENSEVYIEKNLKKLNKIYPDYSIKVSDFVKNDPVRCYRNNVSIEIISQEISYINKYKKTILFVSLTIGGGTQVATDDLSLHLKNEGFAVLVLSSPKPGVWRISSQISGVFIEYKIENDFKSLLKDLRVFDVWHIHYHHTLQFEDKIWDLPKYLNCQYDVTLHDYYSICPRVNLINESNVYCGEPDEYYCNKCIEKNGVHASSLAKISDFQGDIVVWRTKFNSNMKNARKVFVPSMDTKKRLGKYFPNIDFSVKIHPEPIKKLKTKKNIGGDIVNVVLIGAIGIHKGFNYLLGCAKYAENNNIPIKFHVIGYTADDSAFHDMNNVLVYGEYKRNELKQLIESIDSNIMLLLSVWPETFSYTLSEALSFGMKILSFDIGAPTERIPEGAGTLIPMNADFGEICSQIILLSLSPGVDYTIGFEYNSYIRSYYEMNDF